MSWRISYRIEMICKSLGIDYHSPYLEKSNFHKDAERLHELYWQIKQINAEIVEIADKHGGEDLSEFLWKDINLLEHADHDIDKLAYLMDERGKNERI